MSLGSERNVSCFTHCDLFRWVRHEFGARSVPGRAEADSGRDPRAAPRGGQAARRAFERLLLLAGAGDMEVAAGHDATPLLGVPPELEPPAVVHVGEVRLLRRLVIDLDVAAQPIVQ